MSGSGSSSYDKRRVREWMMAAIDDELSAEDRAKLDRVLAEHEELRAEWDTLRGVRKVTASLALRNPPDEIWDDYWQDTYRRFERGIAWVFISVSAFVLMAYGLWQGMYSLWTDSETPVWIRICLFAMIIGGGVLVFSVFREKWFAWKRDPYRGVRR
jgi:ferric-dicitrate binding protein FerR (iron transport regulator)